MKEENGATEDQFPLFPWELTEEEAKAVEEAFKRHNLPKIEPRELPKREK